MESNFSIEFLLKSNHSNKSDSNTQMDLAEVNLTEAEIRKSLQQQHFTTKSRGSGFKFPSCHDKTFEDFKLSNSILGSPRSESECGGKQEVMTLDGGGYNLTGQQMTFNFMYPSQYTTLQTHYHGLNQRAYDQSVLDSCINRVTARNLDSYRPHPRKRRRLNSAQILKLEQCYTEHAYLSTRDRYNLSETLGLTETQVKIWFQNRRAKSKRLKADLDRGKTEG
ncbi:hypothetical protein ACHWQZ_G008355 [Mnemiopsis leidyi]